MLFLFFLETCKVDYVLFEAAGLLKDGLIREWASLSNDEVKGLRSYLLSYVINHPTLSSYIRERIVQVVAIAIKRQSVDDLGEDRRQVRNMAQTFFEIVITELQSISCLTTNILRRGLITIPSKYLAGSPVIPSGKLG